MKVLADFTQFIWELGVGLFGSLSIASIRRFLRLVGARLYQVLVHRDSCGLRIVSPDGLIDPPVRFRGVAQIALNLLEGAAVLTRAQQLRTYGVPLPDAAFDFRPRPLA